MMINKIVNFIDYIIGLDFQPLTFYHMAARTIIVYVIAVVLIRLIKRRLLFSRPSSFDLVLIFLLGSVISRAITGNVPFFPTLGAAIILIILHAIFSYITLYSSWFGALIKGVPIKLIEDGNIKWDQMKKSQITEKDLLSSLRRSQILDPRDVKLAVLERNGEISVIKKKAKLHTTDIKVENGIQIIRLKIDD